MKNINPSWSDFIAKLKSGDIQKIKIGICDIDGIVRGKMLHRAKALKILESDGSLGFCNVVFGWDCQDKLYDNATYTGWHTGYPDTPIQIDPSTLRFTPWDNNTPFLLAELQTEDSVCPRKLLQKISKRADHMGYIPYFGQEFEWFNFYQTPQGLADEKYNAPKPISPGMFGYSLLRSQLNKEYFNQIFDDLEKFNIPLEGFHTETGPGVYEAAITYSPIMLAADRACLFKMAVKEIGLVHGIMPTFMAKWNKDLPGCSGHIHQSLWDKEHHNNLFQTPLKEFYLAGLLKGLNEFLPFFAPTINSYKRLVRGTWAPTGVNWGYDNRTVAIRDLTKGTGKAARYELRVPGCDVNSYIAMAASLALGLEGIKNEWKLNQAPIVGNGYIDNSCEQMSGSLEQAIEKLQDSKMANDLLGEKFVQHFIQTRKWEVEQYKGAITNWEFERYFENI